MITVEKKTKNYSTSYSRVVPHHSTDDAITSLTSEIGRDPVLSGVYGRSWTACLLMDYICGICDGVEGCGRRDLD